MLHELLGLRGRQCCERCIPLYSSNRLAKFRSVISMYFQLCNRQSYFCQGCPLPHERYHSIDVGPPKSTSSTFFAPTSPHTQQAPCNISRHWIIHPSDYLRSSGLVFTFCDSVSCRRHRLLTQWILLEILYVRQFSLHRQWLYTWGQDKCQETVRRCENAYHKPEAPVCYRLQDDFVTG